MKIGRIKLGKFFIYRGHILDRCFLASRPDISCVDLDEIVGDPDAMVRIRTAHRGDLSEDDVRKLLNDIDRNVRFAILSNEKIEIALGQLWAMSDKDEEDFIQKKALERLIEGNGKKACVPSIFFDVNIFFGKLIKIQYET